MKFLLLSSLLLSFSLYARTEYTINDGSSPPGTFTAPAQRTTIIEQEEMAPAAASQTGVRSGGVRADQMNTAPVQAPGTDKEVIDSTVLRDEAHRPKETQQAQEEGPMDYSTTPKKKVPEPKKKVTTPPVQMEPKEEINGY